MLYKSNKKIKMLFGKYADKGDNSVNNPNIQKI